ncbi:hypothetical protein FH609_018660 [Streptomyces sp. 3MP-14]|uniref:DUF4232 domain-containing protein n=1 Tax=Streptomyces mimosae TaxID=2586635 RepID=A0A5N6A8B5_9ACTN|nr:MULTISPECIES: hypothetical protein [Streptomyces]KAB8163698.1 hypothetical protein FH607_017200 [Streptomyces mimosae]KAB8175141.1 hypothetical protein FH609_018660 [Streptomyces sp. 3MP-14]
MTEHRPGPRREPDREPTDAHPEREPTAREGDAPSTDAGRPDARGTDARGTDGRRPDAGSGAFGVAERGRHEAGAPGRGAGRHEDLGDLPPEHADGAEDAEVEELRRLFRDAVGDLEPGPDSLDNLRVAVPLRRRRRRHLLLGTAASVALLSVGAPLMASVADSVGGQDSSMDTSNGGGPPGSYGESGGPGDTGEPYPSGGGGLSDQSDGGVDSDGGLPFGSGDPGEGDPTDARETLGVTSPSCLREQLGRVVTDTEPPDEDGRIYGLIRMVNVSNEPCRVTGEGELAVLSEEAGSNPVRVVDRTEGDRATGLPAPEEAHDELILPPGEGFEVRFAWVPDGPSLSGCAIAASPTPGAGSSHSPQLRTDDPEGSATGGDSGGDAGGSGDSSGAGGAGGTGDSDGSTTTSGASGSGGAGGTGATGTAGASGSPGSSGSDSTGAEGAGGDSDGQSPGGSDPGDASGGTPGGDSGGPGGTSPPVDGGGSDGESTGVVLRYTPAAGEPEAARIVLDGTCSGTIYRTGVLAPAG